MQYIFAVLMVFIVCIFAYIIKQMLETLKEITKLIKANDLNEYNTKWEEQIKDVWQIEERYKDINELSNEELRNIDINPNGIIQWYHKEKSEKFN